MEKDRDVKKDAEIINKHESHKKLTLKRKRIIAIVSVIIAVAVMLWLGFFLTKALMFSVDTDGGVRTAAKNFRDLINSYGNAGILVAFAIQVLQVVVSPIPGEVIELGMGMCFNWWAGALICLLGGALAAAVIMLFVKKFGIKLVELFVSAEKINELKFINNEKKLKTTVLLLYLIPGTPKDPLIFFFGLTKISVWDFVWISTLARIPSIITSTIAGEQATKENFWTTAIILVITGILALIGMFFYKKIVSQRQSKKEKQTTENKG